MRKNNKVLTVIAVTVMIFVGFVGCGTKQATDQPAVESDVNVVVEQFMTAAKVLDIETMSGCVADTANLDWSNSEWNESIEQYVDLYHTAEQSFTEMIMPYTTKLSWTINSVSGDELQAAVNVVCNYVDLSSYINTVALEYGTRYMESALNGQPLTDPEDVQQMILQIMEEKQDMLADAISTKELTINCLKDNGQWKLSEVSDELKNVILLNIPETFSNLQSVIQNFQLQ